jgi:hypothetical protein
MGKGALQGAFRDKVKVAKDDPSRVASQAGWSGCSVFLMR